ncbi:MAG: RNA-binding S4 domain-containing protein [Novosphingobium sp.]
MRIDKLLWFLRFARSRSAAQHLVKEGHLRRNGQRVIRVSQPVEVSDVLTIPLANRVVVIRIEAIPARRGPATEARECYRVLDADDDLAIAGRQGQMPETD